MSPRERSHQCVAGQRHPTSTATDLAVRSWFFVVSDASAFVSDAQRSFTPDASGNLVNSAGYYLMAANVRGVSPLAANSLTGLQKVNVVNAGQTATATTSASLTANLPSAAAPSRRPICRQPTRQARPIRATSRRVRQSGRLAHDQHLLHQHRAQHLGGGRIRCVGRFCQRRLSLFVRTAGDADLDSTGALLWLAASFTVLSGQTIALT